MKKVATWAESGMQPTLAFVADQSDLEALEARVLKRVAWALNQGGAKWIRLGQHNNKVRNIAIEHAADFLLAPNGESSDLPTPRQWAFAASLLENDPLGPVLAMLRDGKAKIVLTEES